MKRAPKTSMKIYQAILDATPGTHFTAISLAKITKTTSWTTRNVLNCAKYANIVTILNPETRPITFSKNKLDPADLRNMTNCVSVGKLPGRDIPGICPELNLGTYNPEFPHDDDPIPSPNNLISRHQSESDNIKAKMANQEDTWDITSKITELKIWQDELVNELDKVTQTLSEIKDLVS